MESPSPAAKEMFQKDTSETYTRISNRVQEIQKEQQEQEEKERQEGLARMAAARQEDGSYALPVGPNGEGKERAQVFEGLEKEFQEALLMQDVDLINQYLATLGKEDAERIVKDADRVGLLTLQVEGDGEEEEGA
jgi:hypothetical protein